LGLLRQAQGEIALGTGQFFIVGEAGNQGDVHQRYTVIAEHRPLATMPCVSLPRQTRLWWSA
jgi:hypothetical protein